MKRKEENEPRKKLGDKVWDGICTTVDLVITVVNPLTYVALLGLGIKEGLNALDDSISNKQNETTNHQENTISSTSINTYEDDGYINIVSTAISLEEMAQIQADHDLAVRLAGEQD